MLYQFVQVLKSDTKDASFILKPPSLKEVELNRRPITTGIDTCFCMFFILFIFSQEGFIMGVNISSNNRATPIKAWYDYSESTRVSLAVLLTVHIVQNKQSLSRICLERVGINFISNLQDKINQNWTLNKIR